MKIIGLDIETTGLLTPDHRIIEIYLGRWDEHGNLKEVYETRIDPRRAIAPEAQRVHGISANMLAGCPTFENVADEILDFIGNADAIVAHNGDEFDLKFINMELKRVGRRQIPSTVPSIDTMLAGRWAMPMGEIPSLQNLCWACEVEYDPNLAHAASYDVEKMMECFFKGLSWGFFQLPCPVENEVLENAV